MTVRRLRLLLLAVCALVLVAGALARADQILGTPQGETLTGTAGDDALYGGGGDDVLQGLAGNDDLDGGPGADRFEGGAGDDAVSYAAATTGVKVSFDGQADDGAPGERDNVGRDVEDAYGGPGDDVLTGDGAANTLDGGAGNDTITGGAGTDGLYGGDGNDVIDSKDGTVDTVDCGAGDDTVDADSFDVVSHCEHRGKATALPSARTTGVVGFDSSTRKGRTTLTHLAVSDVNPPTAGVRVLCHGGGCPFASKAFALADGAVDLTPAFRSHPLRSGATVVVLVAAPDTVGKYAALTMRAAAAPKSRFACTRPKGTTPITCPKGG
jgi:hypothetical protein